MFKSKAKGPKTRGQPLFSKKKEKKIYIYIYIKRGT